MDWRPIETFHAGSLEFVALWRDSGGDKYPCFAAFELASKNPDLHQWVLIRPEFLGEDRVLQSELREQFTHWAPVEGPA